jgi:hypothetical protein
MLVVCPCGKKLNVGDTLAGKKVRCPVCKDVFLAQPDDSGNKGNVSVAKKQTESRSEPSLPAKQRQPLSTKQPKRPPVEEDDDDLLEEYEAAPSRSSRKERQDAPAKKAGTGLVRNLISSVILVVLLIAAGVVFWYKLQAPGTVTFDIRNSNYSVFVDGKEIPVTKSAGLGTVSITLSPGSHDVKITKDGCVPFQKQVTIKSGEEERIDVLLLPTTLSRGAP